MGTSPRLKNINSATEDSNNAKSVANGPPGSKFKALKEDLDENMNSSCKNTIKMTERSN